MNVDALCDVEMPLTVPFRTCVQNRRVLHALRCKSVRYTTRTALRKPSRAAEAGFGETLGG